MNHLFELIIRVTDVYLFLTSVVIAPAVLLLT